MNKQQFFQKVKKSLKENEIEIAEKEPLNATDEIIRIFNIIQSEIEFDNFYLTETNDGLGDYKVEIGFEIWKRGKWLKIVIAEMDSYFEDEKEFITTLWYYSKKAKQIKKELKKINYK